MLLGLQSTKVPPQLGNLSFLAGNQFQGFIPDAFGSLTSLEFLDLSNNNLSGKISKSLEALLHLKQLNMSYNRLEGEIRGAFQKHLSSIIYLELCTLRSTKTPKSHLAMKIIAEDPRKILY